MKHGRSLCACVALLQCAHSASDRSCEHRRPPQQQPFLERQVEVDAAEEEAAALALAHGFEASDAADIASDVAAAAQPPPPMAAESVSEDPAEQAGAGQPPAHEPPAAEPPSEEAAVGEAEAPFIASDQPRDALCEDSGDGDAAGASSDILSIDDAEVGSADLSVRHTDLPADDAADGGAAAVAPDAATDSSAAPHAAGDGSQVPAAGPDGGEAATAAAAHGGALQQATDAAADAGPDAEEAVAAQLPAGESAATGAQPA